MGGKVKKYWWKRPTLILPDSKFGGSFASFRRKIRCQVECQSLLVKLRQVFSRSFNL